MYFRSVVLIGSLMMILFFQNCGQVAFSPGSATLLATNSPGGPNGIGGVPNTGDGPPVVSDPPPSSNPPAVSDASEPYVECDLGSPSNKIILGLNLSSSNAVNTRVCMPASSCLGIVNDYISAHGGNLVAGPATTPSAHANCTQIFPGSAGSCKNAQPLQAADVATILHEMANQ